MSAPSRITFRVNIPSGILIGLCYRNAVEQQGFLIQASSRKRLAYLVLENTGHGTYLLDRYGCTYSHSNALDNFKQKCSR